MKYGFPLMCVYTIVCNAAHDAYVDEVLTMLSTHINVIMVVGKQELQARLQNGVPKIA